jgi:hypothetical protein
MILLPQPLEGWDYRHVSHIQQLFGFCSKGNRGHQVCESRECPIWFMPFFLATELQKYGNSLPQLLVRLGHPNLTPTSNFWGTVLLFQVLGL